MDRLPGIEIIDATPNQSAELAQPVEDVRVEWQWWKMNQMRSHHGAPSVVDLGDISDE
jgi:hypothetical protein